MDTQCYTSFNILIQRKIANTGKTTSKKMWMQIAKCMKEKKYNFTYNQCCSKMDSLKRRYRQVVDHNSQSGNDRKEWTYMDVIT